MLVVTSCFAERSYVYIVKSYASHDRLEVLGIRGGKIWFFGVKSWFFTRNTPTIFAPPSARRNFFKCVPPNLKSWIRPWVYICRFVYNWSICIAVGDQIIKKRKFVDPIHRSNTATFPCLSQTRAWISRLARLGNILTSEQVLCTQYTLRQVGRSSIYIYIYISAGLRIRHDRSLSWQVQELH